MCSQVFIMALTVKAEANHALETVTNGIDKLAENFKSAAGADEKEYTLPTQYENGASSYDNAKSSGGQARKPFVAPKLNDEVEQYVRATMNKARKVVNGEEPSEDATQDVKDLALLATNLIQLMNSEFFVSLILNHPVTS
jgi:hypothetical protein